MPKEYGCRTTLHGKYLRWGRQGKIKKVFSIARKKYKSCHQKNNWFAVDSSAKKSPFSTYAGKNPTDRAKRGIKHVLLVDRKGAPLYAKIAAANNHDSLLLSPL